MTEKEFHAALMALIPDGDLPALEALRRVMEERAAPLREEGEGVATSSLGAANIATQTEVEKLFDESGLPLITACRIARAVWADHEEWARALGEG